MSHGKTQVVVFGFFGFVSSQVFARRSLAAAIKPFSSTR